MKTKTLTKNLGIVVVILLMTALSYSEAFAWSGSFRIGDRRDRGWNRSYRRDYGRSRDSDFFGFKIVFAPQPRDIVVRVPVEQKAILLTEDTVTIYVPNSNGSYTPVMLVRHGNGYIGPQGEYYAGNPTLAQLKVLYGR